MKIFKVMLDHRKTPKQLQPDEVPGLSSVSTADLGCEGLAGVSSISTLDSDEVSALTTPCFSTSGGPKEECDESQEVAAWQPSKPVRMDLCQCCFEIINNHIAQKVLCVGESDSNSERSGKPMPKHLFCTHCLQRYVEEWVFGIAQYQLVHLQDGSVALPCIASRCALAPNQNETMNKKSEGEDMLIPKGRKENKEIRYFTHESIQKSVSSITWSHYVKKIRSCCYTANGIPPGSVSNRISVKNCKKKENNERDSSTANSYDIVLANKYNEAAEALTEAALRRCPTCHAQFMKEDGACNKIRCFVCRSFMCYVCRKSIDDSDRENIDHFCNHSFNYRGCKKKSCSKCPLWPTIESNRREYERIKGIAVDIANRVWEESLIENGFEIRLDVDALLKKPMGFEVV